MTILGSCTQHWPDEAACSASAQALAAAPALHFDFYRFDDPQEWEDAGLRDVFAGPGLKLAEWPEKARALLPPADLRVHIEPQADESRRVTFTAQSARGLELLP